MNDSSILPCDVEKFVLDNGSEIMLAKVRIGHSVDGKVATGRVVDVMGNTTETVKRLYMSRVKRHVAIGWKAGELVEMPGAAPYSRRR